MNEEIWKPITVIKFRTGTVFEAAPGYEVSNLGRVRSPQKIMSGQFCSGGYVNLTIPHISGDTSKKRRIRAHTLVMQTFMGYPEHGQIIRHKNDIKTDNRLENLEWGSKSDNYWDWVKNKTSVII